MSKSISHHFSGTGGHKAFYGNDLSGFIDSRKTAEEVIKERTKDLDTNPHPILHKKVLSKKQMSKIGRKIDERSATMKEYKNYKMTERLDKRRKKAVKDFFRAEKYRLEHGLPTTRKWTPEQERYLRAGERPRFNGKTIQGHHTYSVKMFPHLADRHEIIYPVTYAEHLYGWHGGNFRNSLPGKPINHIKSF